MAQTNILVVGGGIGGMAAAVRLAGAGWSVDLIDFDPEWRVYGAGITITGPTLRAYKRLGLLDEIRAQGAITNGTRIVRYDGVFLNEFDEPALEEGLPATGGIMRPALHRIMQQRVAELDISVRLGLTVNTLEQDADGVNVGFSDGSGARYGAVIGADGLHSKVRSLAFDDAVEPTLTGQGCWRVSTRRPPDFDRGEIYVGHTYTAGITACAPDTVYLYMLTPHKEGERHEGDAAFERLHRELAAFGGNAAWVRDHMSPSDFVNYRPLAAALQPTPWSRGRVVLLGDAAHATTPHLASGAGLAVEDGLVLGDELDVPGRGIQEALLAYSERRLPRCRFVVESSLAIGRAQMEGRIGEVAQLSGQALHQLATEY